MASIHDIRILTMKIRRFKKAAVDCKFQYDHIDDFRNVINSIPGTWHYIKDDHAYKCVRQGEYESIERAIVELVRNCIEPHLSKIQFLRIQFEYPASSDNRYAYIYKELSKHFKEKDIVELG